MNGTKTRGNDAKKVFKELGTCSRTFYYLLNREFEHLNEIEERASDPLAGGIMQQGQQCGMLWGATLAVGAESYRRSNNKNQAIGLAITSTKYLMESFFKNTHTVNCRDITKCDLDSFFGMAKFILKTTFKGIENSICFNLTEKWAPEAIKSAKEGLAQQQKSLPMQSMSCASEVARKMGANDEEVIAVAGFAGGLGLSGNACGALSAAIWKNSITWSKLHPEKSTWKNQNAKDTLKAFKNETDSEMLCHNICGRRFKNIEDHTEFISNGGCKNLINILACS